MGQWLGHRGALGSYSTLTRPPEELGGRGNGWDLGVP